MTDAALDEFVRRFRQRALAKAEWTHEAHLAVGAWHVYHFGVHAAIAMLRDGIRRLNESHGVANTDAGGYHETITCAYAHLLGGFLMSCPGEQTLAERVQALLDSPLAHRDALLEHYTKARLMSVQARRHWVDPDRKALG